MSLKVDLEKLIKNFKITNLDNFILYLKDVWNDLSQRSDKKGISKVTFNSYYKLPGLISQRLFSVFDLKNKGSIDLNEFINGMKSLFYDSFETSSKFIFNFYDFDKDGLIDKNDIRTVLSYISSDNLNYDSDIITYFERINSQEDLCQLLDNSFKCFNQEKIDYEDFIYLIENIGSDIYLLILLFLLEKKPFNKNAINEYNKNKENLKLSPNQNNKITLIASPLNLNSKLSSKNPFQRRNKKRKTFTGKVAIKNSGVLNFWKTRSESSHPNDNDNENENENEEGIIFKNNKIKNEKIPVQRKTKTNLKNIEETSSSHKKKNNNNEYKDINLMPAYKYNKINKVNDTSEFSEENEKKNFEENLELELENEEEEEEEEEKEKEENYVKYEGYLYKLIDNIKLKRLWFKLLYKDFYFYKEKEDKIHKGMHNLSGVFLKENPPVNFNDIKFYNFSIIYPKRERIYYTNDENEYKNWIENLKISTEYTNLNDLYEITKNLGMGKHGLIKLGINKKTNKKVAIKILCKANMKSKELQYVKTEIDILKICNHPNIIHLYDIFENENFFYIIMEYCSGGDLFSYLEKNKFHISERQSCKIIYKILKGLSYLHSYGIIHRDIKSENILITYNKDEELDIRINDFGLSKILGPCEFTDESCGTLSYVAPEVLLNKKYNNLVDSWSLGVTSYLLISGSLPFDHPLNDKEITRKTINDQPNFYSGIWENISHECIDFIRRLLEKNPKKRMTVKLALEHEWIKKYNSWEQNKKVKFVDKFN